MVEPQSAGRVAGRAKIADPEEKIDNGEYTLEDFMQKIEAIPSNKRLLRQIGVRESVQRVRAWCIRTHACRHMCPSARCAPAHRLAFLLSCAQCISAKARHLAEYEMKDPRVLAIVTSLMGWEMKVGAHI